MAKIVIIIPLWKRPDVFRICAENLLWFINNSPHDLQVLTVISPEDPHVDDLFEITTRFGFESIYAKNIPVSNKLNTGIKYCYDNYDFDYIMNMGSDDLIHPKIFELYEKPISLKKNFFGINNLYFYNSKTEEAIHYHTYNNLRAIGAGRMISRHVIKQFLFKHKSIYESGVNRGLDGNSAYRIIGLLHIRDLVIDSDRFPYVVDIKSKENINHFDPLRKLTNRITYVKKAVITEVYPHVLL